MSTSDTKIPLTAEFVLLVFISQSLQGTGTIGWDRAFAVPVIHHESLVISQSVCFVHSPL